MIRRPSLVAGLLLGLLLGLVGSSDPVRPAAAQGAPPAAPRIFTSTGGEQTIVVTNEAAAVVITAVGGGGRGDQPQFNSGGNGAVASVQFRVTGTGLVRPGQTLYVNVGGNGGDAPTDRRDEAPAGGAGGFNGGGAGGGITSGGSGGGGGASDVRTCSRAGTACPGVNTLATRLVVAGGGGGGGGVGGNVFLAPRSTYVCCVAGGNGGTAGLTAEAGKPGSQGSTWLGGPGGQGGGGASQTAGGAGGQPGSSTAGAGAPGSFGTGGAPPGSSRHAPGGGGGWFGGGAGGTGGRDDESAPLAPVGSGGGGGAGSNYYAGGALPPSVGTDTTGTPTLTIGFIGRVRPVTSCTTLATGGAYQLQQDLAGPLPADGSCLNVTADQVALDLNGHTVRGAGTGMGIRIRRGTNWVVVSNGAVTGFRVGAQVGGDNATLRGLDLRGNTEAGAVLEATTKSQVTGSQVGSSRYGVLVRAGSGNVVSGNTATFASAGLAIVLTKGTSAATVKDNTLALGGDQGEGIVLSDTLPLAVRASGPAPDCRAGDVISPVPEASARNATIAGNVVTGGRTGIALECGSVLVNTITGNSATGQRVVGLYDGSKLCGALYSDDPRLTHHRYRNTWTGNTGTRNQEKESAESTCIG